MPSIGMDRSKTTWVIIERFEVKVAVMSQTMQSSFIPSAMEEKLSQISRRQAAISVLRAVAIGASVLFASMVVAMLIDWQLTLFSTGFRMTLTITSLLLSVAAVLIAGVPSLAASLKRIQAAVNADEAIPHLEERWQTVVGAAISDRRTSATAKAMLRQVTSEAVAIGRIVQPRRVAGPKSHKTALITMAACAVLLTGFLAIDWPQTSVLLRRFFAPAANISATSLVCPTGDVTIARGEFVDLVAEMQGLRRKSAILTVSRTDSKPETVELEVDKKGADRFVHRLQADESFQYRVRAGDGQTGWHTVTVVDYPELAEVRFTIVAPAYLNRPNVEKSIIPGRLKVIQGSLLQLKMRPKEPLERLILTIALDVASDGQPLAKAQNFALTADKDGWYQFNTQLTENLSIVPQLWNSHGLTNEERTVCRIQVIADNAPVARVLTPTDEMSVAADDVIDIKFEAHDDHGITQAELVVYDESAVEEGKQAPVLKVMPIPLGDRLLAKHVVGMTKLDLKQLNLKPGTQVSYAVRVTDNRAVANEQSTTSPRQTPSTEPTAADKDSDRKPPSSNDVAETRSKDIAETQSDASSKLSQSDAADRLGDDSAKETAKVADQSGDSAKSRGKEAASAPVGSDLAQGTPAEPKTPRKNLGEKPATAAAKIAGTAPEKDSQLEGAKATNNSSDAEKKRPSDNNINSSDSDNSPFSNLKKDASGNTKSIADDKHQSPDPANPPTGGAPGANRPEPKSKPSDTKEPALKKDASNTERVELPMADDIRPGQPMPPADEREPGKSNPKSDTNNSKSDDIKANKKASNKATDDAEKATDTASDTARKPADQNPTGSGNPTAGQGGKGQKSKSNKSEDGPPPDRVMAMTPQQSEAGQNSETNRRFLKITERLSAIAEARDTRKAETNNVRERVVEIDGMLAETEKGLTQIVNREIPDNEQSAQYKGLDAQLGKVISKISALRKATHDDQFAFVGLQMLDIRRSHISPAREKVFLAIREPVSASSGSSRAALQQIVRARELLAALLKRYDRVARDQQLAEAIKDGVKMYEVYVEKMQQLMREARQNQNPLDRKMAVIEVDQQYLDRYAEVLTIRRDMMAEFGRILGDDPRLLARYLDLVKRRRSSLRDQLSELAKSQKEVFGELSGWQSAEAAQREDLWDLAVELRMQASTQLAKDAAELGERIEKQFPLVLEASQQTPAKVIALGREIAETSRGISLEAKRQIREPDAAFDLRPKARQLTRLFVDLDAILEQLGFEHSKETEVTTYVTGRLLESRTVADQADLWRQTAEHVHGKQYHGFVAVDQHRIAITTELLRVELLGIETELSAQFQQLAEKTTPEPIVAQIRELQRLMSDITFEQTGAEFAMTENRLPASEKLLKRASDNFTRAEELFDQMRRAIAAALDEAKVPNPTVAELEDPKLDEFLTQLEREPNIDAQLGIPERPRNLRIIADSMIWQEGGAVSLGAVEEEARARMKEEQRERKVQKGPVDPGKPETEPKENEQTDEELTEEERQKQEQMAKTRAELVKAIEAQKERAKDPAADPEELKKLAQAAREIQEKLDNMQQAMDPDKLWKPMKADLERTLVMLKETKQDPSTATVDSQRIEMLTRDLQRLLDQIRKEQGADNRWKMVAEFERKKDVLNAVARGERIPDEQWNKLLSKLDDGLWQVGGRSLPEEYRKAIEQYQEQIRKLTNSGKEDDR
jgi:hypothetical protein